MQETCRDVENARPGQACCVKVMALGEAGIRIRGRHLDRCLVMAPWHLPEELLGLLGSLPSARPRAGLGKAAGAPPT